MNGISEVFCGELSFSGQTLGCEKILHPVAGHGRRLEVSLVHQPFQKGVDQAQRDVQTLREFPLAVDAVVVDFIHQTQSL